MTPTPSPVESLPLLSGASASSGRRVRPRNASFESGFPLVVDASHPSSSADNDSSDSSSDGGRAELPRAKRTRSVTARTRRWASMSASGPLLTLTLVMSAVGAGTLAVPYTFVLLPPVPAVLALSLVGGAMFFTADAILRVHVAVAAAAPKQERHATYQALALAAGGSRLSNLAGALTAFAVFGACVGCVRVVRDMVPSLLAAIHAGAETPSDSSVIAAVWAVFMAVVLPLGFSRNISALRFSSYLGFAFSLYLVAAVAFRAVSSRLDDERPLADDDTAQVRDQSSLMWRLAETIGIYNFTFMLHLNVIPLLAQLVAAEAKHLVRQSRSAPVNGNYSSISIDDHQPAPDDDDDEQQEEALYLLALERGENIMRTRLAVAITACVMIYAVFGLCAASIYGPSTKGNILLNLERDPIMAVPRVAILFTILFSFPLLFHPLRALVLEMAAWPLDWWRSRQAPNAAPSACACSTTMTLAVSVALLTAQILCALHVPGIQVVFSFVGASILLVLCYLLPLAFFFRLFPWRSTSEGAARLAALTALAAVATVFCSLATAELMWQ